jgi:kynurenine formamidase
MKSGDIIIVHTVWNKCWGDNTNYFCYSPSLGRESGEWFVAHKARAVGVDQQALDHPQYTAIGHQEPVPLRKDVCEEYKKETGHDVLQDFPEWKPCHNLLMRNGLLAWENVGGDIAKVVGKRCKISGFPIRWYIENGSLVRMVAYIDKKDLNPVPTRVYKYGTT